MSDLRSGPKDNTVRAIVTDIEGTTTDIAFVHGVLFPYARARLRDFVETHADEPAVAGALAQARTLAAEPDIIQTLLRWSDEDRKIGPLKTLQGLLWEAGYRDGSLVAPVYDDVVPALRTWKACGLSLYVYSSGSVAAQKLLFGHTTAGDLTPLFDGYFDTAIGGKLEEASYGVIAGKLALAPDSLLFLSDHPGEIAAARAAGWQAMRVVRDGPAVEGEAIRSFAELAAA